MNNERASPSTFRGKKGAIFSAPPGAPLLTLMNAREENFGKKMTGGTQCTMKREGRWVRCFSPFPSSPPSLFRYSYRYFLLPSLFPSCYLLFSSLTSSSSPSLVTFSCHYSFLLPSVFSFTPFFPLSLTSPLHPSLPHLYLPVSFTSPLPTSSPATFLPPSLATRGRWFRFWFQSIKPSNSRASLFGGVHPHSAFHLLGHEGDTDVRLPSKPPLFYALWSLVFLRQWSN